MNTTFKTVLISGASALVGAVAGYIFCKKTMESVLQKKFEDAINAEIANIRKGHEEKEELVEGGIPEETSDAPSTVHIPEEFLETDNEYYNSLVIQKQAFWRSQGLNEDIVREKTEEFVNMLLDLPPDEEDNDKEMEEAVEFQSKCEKWAEEDPFVIPCSEYDELEPYFERVTWRYFEDDDVLIDNDEMIISDIETFVGDALMHFDEEPEDGDCVYVQNGRNALAIEIIRMHTSFGEWSGLR